MKQISNNLKLTRRQKRIITIATVSFFLVLGVIISTVLVANSNKKGLLQKSEKNNNSPPNNADLVAIKTQKVDLLGAELSSNNIKVNEVVKELKNNGYLKDQNENESD
jgi:hypothetical protein